MGAVNCVVRRSNQWIGENTDGKGFLRSLQSLTDPAGKSVVLFGAGGAARAIAVELAMVGAKKITVVNRSQDRGSGLASVLQTKVGIDSEFVRWQGEYVLHPTTDIVINATSIGLYDADARLALDLNSLRQSMIVADVIENPPRTSLIGDAEARGCRVLDGIGMLVNQGIIAVNYWSGVEPDAEVMRRALLRGLGL